MKHQLMTLDATKDMESGLAVYGAPRGDELPQVAGVEDILMDVYSDILNMPRQYAAGHFHHQYTDDFEDGENIIH